MSKRDEFYHEYRRRTLAIGITPIGKRRFNGIMDVVKYMGEIPEKENI